MGKRTRITGLRTVGVPVGDRDRALKFYGDVLGFETRVDTTGQGMRWVEVAPPGASTSIALVAATEETPPGTDTGIRLTTEDAEADHTYLAAHGVQVDPAISRWPGVPPMFQFSDPDGNRLVIIQSA